MSLLDEIKTSNSDPRRFIGRPASPCRKCRGVRFYVSRFGAVACGQCAPPKAASDALLWLVAQSGRWADPHCDAEPIAPVAKAGVVMRRWPADRIECARHAFADDFREWGWIDAAEFIDVFEHVNRFPDLRLKGDK